MAQVAPTTTITEPIPKIVRPGRPPKPIPGADGNPQVQEETKVEATNGHTNGKSNGHEDLTLQVQEYIATSGIVMPSQVVKRDGRVVPFDMNRIEVAMKKCFDSFGRTPSFPIADLAKQVVNIVSAKYTQPTVENVQDTVEMVLQAAGEFEAAKRYILYRQERANLRDLAQASGMTTTKLEATGLNVKKRDGTTENFDESKLKEVMSRAAEGIEDIVDVDMLVRVAKASLYDGITTREIAKVAYLAARGFIEKDPAYDKMTTRLFLSSLYKEVMGKNVDDTNLIPVYQQSFIENIKKAVEIERLAPEMLEYDLDLLSRNLDVSRDAQFTYKGLENLYDRYFLQDIYNKKRRMETPQAFFMRIAMGLAINEKDREAWAIKFYRTLSSFRFMSSSPTLFNAGTRHPQLSSCYLTTIEDDLHHIFKCIGDNAQLSKWSGGIGHDWTNLRATGALIKKVGIMSNGIVPFLKIANDTTVAISRSGRKRGATCAYLETWHMDVEEFLDLRRNTGDERRRTPDMNTANWIPDLFMKRVAADAEWTLFSPDETPELHHIYGKAFEEKYQEYEQKAAEGKIELFKKVRARDLWKKMITRLFETGHPWITFKDPSNIRSPQDHAGVIHSSNLCTEITLNTSKEETAVCNLGSVNLSRHIVNGRLDKELIKETVTVAMRMLDNVIDITFYPTVEARDSNIKHRPVGMGIMGYQDALFMLNIPFDSEEAVQFSDESMEAVAYYAYLTSSKLAAERGTYESYKGSKWDRGIFPQDTLDLLEQERGVKIDVPRGGKMDWSVVREAVRVNGMRNSNCLAIAPTSTISYITDSLPTIEPIYKNIFVYSNISGEFTMVNRYLVDDLKALGMWNDAMIEEIKAFEGSIQNIVGIPAELKTKYKEAFEIHPKWLIKQAAYRGKWIDQSQSVNIFSSTSSGKELADIYMYAWEMGLKTTYYLRTLAASGVEKSTVDLKRQSNGHINGDGGAVTTKEETVIPEPVVTETIVEEVVVTAAPAPMPEPMLAVAQVPVPPTPVVEEKKVEVLEQFADGTVKIQVGKEIKLGKACLITDPECEACQ